MIVSETQHFFKTIYHLRTNEEILLSSKNLRISDEECNAVVDFLSSEYDREKLEYPGDAPEFDKPAALWAAKTVYIAAQLFLYRDNNTSELESLFPSCERDITSSAIVSADIILRFLPVIIHQLKLVDRDDKMIEILEGHIRVWHYSGVSYNKENIEELNFDNILSDPFLREMYIDRIIEYKSAALAKKSPLKEYVKAGMGNYVSYYWKELID